MRHAEPARNPRDDVGIEMAGVRSKQTSGADDGRQTSSKDRDVAGPVQVRDDRREIDGDFRRQARKTGLTIAHQKQG